jgi:DNA-binding SARP family transcriptional activator
MIMKPEIIAQIIVQKGLKNVNLTMFSEDEKRKILEALAEIYIRQGRADEVLDIIESVDVKKFTEMMKTMAENAFQLGEYEKAARIYEKIGDAQFATYIRENFLKK